MRIIGRSLVGAGSVGFVIKMILALVWPTLFTILKQGSSFGTLQENRALGLLIVVAVMIIGFFTYVGVGAFYSWLSRRHQVGKKDIVKGGALTAGLVATMGLVLKGLLGLSMATPQTPLPSMPVVGIIFVGGVTFNAIFGALGGALGAWTAWRPAVSDAG